VEGATRIRRGSVSIPNQTVYDSSISYAALGLLAILLARPEDAPQGYRNLMRPAASVGQASILRGLEELVAAGYRRQFLRTSSNAKGRNIVLTDTYISEAPLSHEQYRAWAREATGVEPIEMPNRKKPKGASKGTLASDCDAHSCDAHSCEAHKPDAQTKEFPGSSKLSRENQGGADAAAVPAAPEQAKRAADADSPTQPVRRAQAPAGVPADAVDAERIHCLSCDHTFYRVELSAQGRCAPCEVASQEPQAAPAAQDPAEVARLAEQARRDSLERQAKRRRITVEQLLAERQPRT
jgi:hypothetical protein